MDQPTFIQSIYDFNQRYYEAIIVTAESTGRCVFENKHSIWTYAYLYFPTFDEIFGSSNLLISGGADNSSSKYFDYVLEANLQYYLVISIDFINDTLPFMIAVRSLGTVSLTKAPGKNLIYHLTLEKVQRLY